MRNYEWMDLTDAERGQLVAIWMLAADKGGQIPADPGKIQQVCYMTKKPDLELFQILGFIEGGAKVAPSVRQGGANPPQHDTPEKRRVETEKSREEESREEGESEGGKQKAVTPPFDDFYKPYPVHKGRATAETAWKNLPQSDRRAAIAGIESYRSDCLRADITFCHPTTYLHQKRWQDEPGPVRSTKNSNKQQQASDTGTPLIRWVPDAEDLKRMKELGLKVKSHDV